MATNFKKHKLVTKNDRRRERELYRYYQPMNDANHISNQKYSPDSVLTALAQLVALRLNVKSVLVNLVDKDTQYTVTEGTKTLHIGNTSGAAAETDGIWLGCGITDKSESICQRTIELPGTPNGDDFYIVPDLRAEEQYAHLFFVTGSPFWRFYIGTPLITKAGITIGALCGLDDKPREAISDDDREFCRAMAAAIISHLELRRESNERKKVIRMSQGLSAFVEGRSRLSSAQKSDTAYALEPVDGIESTEPSASLNNHTGLDGSHMTQEAGSASMAGCVRPTEAQLAESPRETHADSGGNNENSPRPHASSYISENRPLTSSSTGSLTTATNTEGPNRIDSSTSEQEAGGEDEQIYTRAASLLRECLGLDDHGGVAFLDASIGFSFEESATTQTHSNNSSINGDDDAFVPPSLIRLHSHLTDETDGSATSNVSRVSFGKGTAIRHASILGISSSMKLGSVVERMDESDDPHSLPEDIVQYLLKKYPRGHMWSLTEDGTISSDSEGAKISWERERWSKRLDGSKFGKSVVTTCLQRCFKGARQLIFQPLWDPQNSRYSAGCFCWTNHEQQIFSIDAEVSFLTAFGNCVMAEMARRTSIAADQRKSDFIGSISHELRSPLHGILASAEFLSETDCDSFQSNLVDTINSCGRTLHQTIEHVLDFAKINSFERNSELSRRREVRNRNKSGSKIGAAPVADNTPLLSIFANVDIAALAEEVVQGTYAGSEFHSYFSSDIASKSAFDRRKINSVNGDVVPRPLLVVPDKHVEVILDIQKGNYTAMTQQGALRRLIMNILGNALKYTEKGMITVRMQMNEPDFERAAMGEKKSARSLVVCISDTGKGISPQYLRTQLFTPFAQENNLAPGTGLGLSMVKSITSMLGGTIDIRSQLGEGTEVTIILPIVSGPGSTGVTPSSKASEEYDDSVSVLLTQGSGHTVALFGFESNPASKELKKVTTHYVSKWYGLQILPSWPSKTKPDITIVDEADVNVLGSQKFSSTILIILCSNATRLSRVQLALDGVQIIEYCTKPFGAYSLAKVVRSCMLQANLVQSQASNDDEDAHLFDAHMIPAEDVNSLDTEKINTETELSLHLEHGASIVAAETNNARRVLDTPSDKSSEVTKHGGVDFPFPTQNTEASEVEYPSPRSGLVHRRSLVRSSSSNHSIRQFDEETPRPPVPRQADPLTPKGKSDERTKSTPTNKQAPQKGRPRVLVVDDNGINLRLLQVFMKKRHYEHVYSAENGQLAVDAFDAAAKEDVYYDIVFMDISMPVMNGFEATRCIRRIEEKKPPASLPALIIALTGMASSNDQSEAFTSGVDLFMTKPVSFKEVGKLLDNWELRFNESQQPGENDLM